MLKPSQTSLWLPLPILLVLSSIVETAPADDAGNKRRFSVQDSVETSYFGTINSSMPSLVADDGVVSPNGQYVLKLTHRGVVTTGKTEGSLWAFDVPAVLASISNARNEPPEPIRVFTLAAEANGLNGDYLDTGNVLFQPQWRDDRTVVLLGRDGGETRRIFVVDVPSRNGKALTPADQDVVAFSATSTSIAYLAAADAAPDHVWWSAGPGIPDTATGTDLPLMPLLYPRFVGNGFIQPVSLEVWRAAKDAPSRVVDASTKSPLSIVAAYNSLVASISPDATKLVVAAYPALTSDNTPSGSMGRPPGSKLQYLVVDLITGTHRPLLDDASLSDFRYGSTGRYLAAWSRSGSAVAVTETMLSPSASSPSAAIDCIVAVVTLDGNDAECVLPRFKRSSEIVNAIEWLSERSIRIQYKEFRTNVFREQILSRKGSRWAAHPGTHTKPIWLKVRESLNSAPQLVAVDSTSGAERVIFDPNPNFADIDLGTASVFEWQDPHGRRNVGGLLLPPGFTPGRQYPLVLQTHGFDPNRFFKVGYSETANAGRALAARDIIVLQVKEPSSREPSWEDAKKNGVDVYVAAIDQLANRGMINPKKVGITGYSYTGWTVAASLTTVADRFAAAVIANSDPVTLTAYFGYVGTPLAEGVVKEYVGASPYGEGLKLWIERVPSWSSHKIRAPVLFSAADPWHLIGVWDLYAALRDQGKPVELQYFRTGQHNIIKARQRFEHQQMIVDWFDFWLNDREDAAAQNPEQYVRWREMRRRKDE